MAPKATVAIIAIADERSRWKEEASLPLKNKQARTDELDAFAS